MKSSSTPQEKEHDVTRRVENRTPSDAPIRSPASHQAARPSLARLEPGRLSELSQHLFYSQSHESETQSEEESTSASASTSDDAEDSGEPAAGMTEHAKDSQTTTPSSASEEERLSKLRDAMTAKLLLQQRMRRSYGSPRTESTSTRVSPIQEEDSASSSPSLNATAAMPPSAVRTQSSLSTESSDSSKTVRASQPATPADAALRTPSYPFPYVPGTPRAWTSNVHQPFMALSPTVGAHTGEDDTPGRNNSLISAGSTPGSGQTMFMPPGTIFPSQEDPRFPTPNLYDLVLELSSEPGLEQWWATVTNIMHDHYKADRATLVTPLDPTDIENVPWGQRATFSMNGPEEFVSHRTVVEQTLSATAPSSAVRPNFMLRQPSDASESKQRLHPERLRPRLEARHSYAGHGRETFNEQPNKPATRPAGPQRTVTHAAGIAGGVGSERLPPRRFPSGSTIRHESLSDPEFSSIAGGVDAGPYAEVFSAVRALDHESHPLIESGGVCRVLDRGRLVAVTRDYSSDDSTTAEKSVSEREPGPSKSAIESLFGNYRNVFASDNMPSLGKDYEEYEQYPTSPWSQSPAPSPAVQANEDTNPFFATDGQHVEDSFNPATTPKDYTKLGQVEAIGVERASTVIHIPLVHPTLSQPMASLKTYPHSSDRPGPPRRSSTLDVERKAPIAILSVLSSVVPYPNNLTQSLKLLGPHLATSYAIAQQFSSSHYQAVTIRHRRTASGNMVTDAPMTIEPTSLADLVNAEIEEPSESLSGSVTSPSEYSSRSKHSPSGSIVGTPGWDPATHGWTSSKSVAGTPGLTGTEMVDNYFDSKKRFNQRSGSNASAQVQGTPVKPVRKVPSSEGKSNLQKSSPNIEQEGKFPQTDRKTRPNLVTKDDRSPVLQSSRQDPSPPRSAEAASPQRPGLRQSVSAAAVPSADKRHSLLHSYGADLNASFGGLPSPSVEPQSSGAFGHARKNSSPEDMPPPSDRLLRTVIDSVPVQIFTAEPDTGRVTWVNSKFMVYRAQKAKEVLGDPWQAIHPDDRKEFMSSWHRSLRTAQQLQQKVRLERFDNSYRWFYVRAAPLKDKRQKIVHWIGTMMDFHDQHTAEVNSARQQEVAASEAKYRALANSSPQIVFAVNKSKGVTFCNTQWAHFSGQKEADALGVGFMDQVHPEDLGKCRLPTFDDESDQPNNVPTSVPPEIHRKASSSGSSETEKQDSNESSPISPHLPQRKLSELARTGILKISRDVDGRPSYSTEVRLKSKDGDYRWHLVRILLAEPLLRGENEEETWYGTCTDINDHKALERDLKETMDEKSRFLSNMSHEIRTPLNGIIGMVNFLIDSSLTAEQLEHVNIIRASTEGLRGLINDILDLSKAEAGMISLVMDWLYVRALIEEVNDLTSTMAIDKGLELNYLVEDDVPTQVKGDRFRIRQILLNVVGNAIKFTEKGEVFIRCSSYQSDSGELAKNEMYLKFDVIDTGRGFNEQEAEHLFKRFSQIDGSSTRQHGGTGLGLVISRQLAQLHGGDMSAKGIPQKGATFTLLIKTTLPSKADPPPLPPPPTPGAINIPILPMSPGPAVSPHTIPKIPTMPMDMQPKFAAEYRQSPLSHASSPDVGRESPSVSSASSDPSLRSAARTSSLRSERSSASSFVPEPSLASPPMKLALPTEPKLAKSDSRVSAASDSVASAVPSDLKRGISGSSDGSLTPPMLSILVLCPLKYSREATVQHIDKTLPANIPHQITARETLAECQEFMEGDDPVRFTHIVLVLQDVDEIVTLMHQILKSPAHQATSIVIITDFAQRRAVMEHAPKYNYENLASERRLLFVFKPLKPSRFAVIFDPAKEREMSTDRNQDSAQQIALTQKQVFDELASRLGNRGKRVLLVEDNRTNQLVSHAIPLQNVCSVTNEILQVVLKFLSKVSIDCDTALDGVECITKVFSRPHGYYSMILCDLHMPNKDGYETCTEIRKWERQSQSSHLPIIALSANVLGDVYQKCVEAGFNSYMTKPVDFKELSTVLMLFMDPSDPNKPVEFMKRRKGSVPLVPRRD